MEADSSLLIEILSTLKPELEKKRSSPNPNLNPELNPSLKRLLENSFELTLEDLNQILEDHLKRNPAYDLDVMSLLYSLLIIKLKELAPLGTQAIVYTSHFLWLYDQNIKFKPALLSTYTSNLIFELSQVKTIEELLMWMDSIGNLKSKGINFQNLDDVFYTKYIKFAWEYMSDTLGSSTAKKILEYLDHVKKAQSFGLEIDKLIKIVGNNVCRFVEYDHDLYGILKAQSLGFNQNFNDGRTIIMSLKNIRIIDEELLERIRNIENLIGSSISNISPSNYLSYYLRIEFICNIDTKTSPKYKVDVWKGFHPELGFVAVKAYTARLDINDLNNFEPERKIMEKLSALSGPDNCFLKYYGHWTLDKTLSLAMEYHEHNLMDKLSEYKTKNQYLSEKNLNNIIVKLANSFCIMANLNIYHEDIKPHNLLVVDQPHQNLNSQSVIIADEFNLKIIDFGISEIKKNAHLTQIINSQIQGTNGYFAPEIQYMVDNNASGNINIEKADVFSLGFTILQIVLMENLVMLNRFDSNPRLIEKVNTVKIPWIKELLLLMLQVDYTRRPLFREIMKYIPAATTKEVLKINFNN
jgi:Protein kinase domain